MKLRLGIFTILLIIGMGNAGYDDPFYDYRGQNSFRESHPYLPEERLDPFTGNFYIIHTDVYLPGNAGLDIRVLRVYNSDIYRQDGVLDVPVPDSWVGLGWSMHMGRLICPTTEYKYLEMSDGSKHQFYLDKNDPSRWISKEFWILKFVSASNRYEVYFTDGIKWTFSLNIFGNIPEAGGTSYIYYPTILISDPFGNKDTIDYQMVTNETFIKWIKDNLGRTITFNYSTTGTKNLNSINVNGKYVYYEYDSINADYSLLTKVKYPEDPTGYYSYRYEYSTTYPENELKKIYNPWGGNISYTYGDNEFDVGGDHYKFRVLTQRQLSSGGIWTIAYGLTSGNCDSVCITDPYTTKTSFVMWGYRLAPPSGSNWKLGLMIRKRVSGSGASCLWQMTYDTNPPFISNDDYWGPTSWDNAVYVPRVTKKEVIIDSKTYTVNYSDFDNYNQPRSISETGDANRTIARTYWYNTGLNIVDRLASENITYGSSTYPSSYSYNSSNGSMSSKNITGVITNYTYHSNGNLERITDHSDRWLEYSQYQYGVPKQIKKDDIYTINRTINWEGTIASETNGRSYITNFQYDGRNRLKRITPPIGDPTIIEYHNQGDYKKVRLDPGWTKYNYDDWGRVDYTENSLGIKVDYSYDRLDRKTFDSYPYTTTRLGDTITYDGLDRVKRITHPDNNYAEYTYYQSKVTYRNERGKNTEFQYNAFGNLFGDKLLMSVKDALNQTTSYTYNAANYLTEISAAGSYTRTYHYNSKYFLDYEISPERGQTDYVYDAAGNLTQRTDANDNITTYTYDDIARLTNINYTGADYDVTYTYDNADNLTQILTPSNTVNQTYDALNRITKKVLNIDTYAYVDSFVYDGRGNITHIKYPDNQWVDLTYDNENRVLTIPGYINSNITYHPSGHEATYTTNNGRSTTIQFDNRYRISRITVTGNIMDEGYVYDAMGNLTTLTDYLGTNDQTFTYDDIDRLKTFNGPWGNGTYNYTSGYAISQRYQEIIGSSTTTYNYTNHRLSSTTGANPYQFTYDNNGNLVGLTKNSIIPTGSIPSEILERYPSAINYTDYNLMPEDILAEIRNLAPNLLQGQATTHTLVYDPENRLIEFRDNGTQAKSLYVYDGNGIRVKASMYDTLTSPYAWSINYYVASPKNEVFFEKRFSSLPVISENKYIYLNGNRLVRIDYNGQKNFYHNDYLGSAKAMTDDTGLKVHSWLGYPFGKQYSGMVNTNYLFTGKEIDNHNGFYYFGARYYMPEIGRFITPEPTGKFENKDPKSINPYVYCTDNPLGYIDPNGKWRIYSHKNIVYVTRQSAWGATVETGVSFVPFMSLAICGARLSQRDITLGTADWIIAGLDVVPTLGKVLGISGKFSKAAFKVIETVGQAGAVYQGLSEIEKSIIDKEIFNRLKDKGMEVYRSNSSEEWLVLGEEGANETKKRLLEAITTEVMQEREERLKGLPQPDFKHYNVE